MLCVSVGERRGDICKYLQRAKRQPCLVVMGEGEWLLRDIEFSASVTERGIFHAQQLGGTGFVAIA